MDDELIEQIPGVNQLLAIKGIGKDKQEGKKGASSSTIPSCYASGCEKQAIKALHEYYKNVQIIH